VTHFEVSSSRLFFKKKMKKQLKAYRPLLAKGSTFNGRKVLLAVKTAYNGTDDEIRCLTHCGGIKATGETH